MIERSGKKRPHLTTSGMTLFCAKAFALLTIVLPIGAVAATGDRLDRDSLSLTWSDGFERGSLDLYESKKRPDGRWKTNYDFGEQSGTSSRTLKGEYQIYVDHNYNGVSPFLLRDGVLTILARRNPWPADAKMGGKAYTSGLMTTSPSFKQKYGYFEIESTFPAIRGAWPAFWLGGPIDLHSSKPQHADEIDVVEFLGKDNAKIYCSAHWTDVDGASRSKITPVPVSGVNRQRRYGVLWAEDRLTWYVDDQEVASMPNPGLNQPMYLLVNLAVGGWNNNVPDKNFPPMQMIVTHIRAYRQR